ncbi:hypothetical protein KAJ27_21835 [bacterium]|nr:hypothetical protein [bacterium]
MLLKKIAFCAILLLLINTTFLLSNTTMVGPSGLVKVPDLSIIGKEKFEMGAHIERYDANRYSANYYNQGMGPFQTNLLPSYETRWYVVGNYGITDKLEIGFMKEFDSNDIFEDPDLLVHTKYVFSTSEYGSFALGGIIDTTVNAYNSIYALYGTDIVFVGIGANFGGAVDKPNNWARLGGYDLANYSPEDFFFLAGVNVKMGPTGLKLEYDGDAFNAGLRYHFNEVYTIDINYLGKNDYDKLYYFSGPFATRYNRERVSIGLNAKF